MKKRILIVVAGNKGTIGMCSRNLYLALQKQEEIEVKCVCVHRFSDGLPEFDDIDYYCPIRSSLWGRIGIIGQVQWLRGIKRQFKPDITISTLFSTSFINVLSGGSGKTIGIFHSPHQQQKVFGTLSYMMTLFNYNFIYPFLDKLACVSQEVKESLAVFPLIRKRKVEVIYNVHNADLIREKGGAPLPKDDAACFAHPCLLYCGRMDGNKAPDRALEAFAMAKETGNMQLVYIGSDESGMMDGIMHRAKDLGIAERVHYLGRKSNPYPYIKQAMALISTSYSEGLPGVMIESLILGTPVVTTNSSKGIWEIFSCVDKYQKDLDRNYVCECGIITPNRSFTNKQFYTSDIQFLAEAISSIGKMGRCSAFEFEQKVSANYIYNQFKNLPEMKLKRFVRKSVFTIGKFFVTRLAYVDSRLYMSCYNRLLKYSGLQIGGGKPRFIAASVKFDTFELIEIGDRTTISSNTILLTHDYSLTNALRAVGEQLPTDVGVIRPISIGNNCFIGMNVVVLPGTVVEDNVIVGAGSVIRGHLESNSVYIGNPAKRIMSIEEYQSKIKSKNYTMNIDSK